jgi:CBS domain containing-hemolysin-like protein
MRAAVFIPESKKIDAILKQMQAAKTHIVVVVDEYGSVAGLVSMEDIIEEIFGEIQDEFERNVKAIEKISESSYLVDGSVLVSDLNQSLSLNLPESRQYDTIAGLMSERLEKVPAIGDRVRIDEVVLLVERVHHRRIGKVKISLNPLADAIEMVGG